MCFTAPLYPPLPLEPDEYVVLEKFDSTADDELNLLPGDVVTTVSIKMDGWWKIRKDGKVGYAPSAILRKQGMEEIAKVSKSSVEIGWYTHTYMCAHTCTHAQGHFVCIPWPAYCI